MVTQYMESKVIAIIPGVHWSTLTSSRYILNFKGISYKIVAAEYYDIETTLKAVGMKPSGKRKDGSDLYTVPSIVDTNTGAKVSDSIKIAVYLEETYPNTPSIFPHNTAALHQAFFAYFNTSIAPIWSTILPIIPRILEDKAKEWYIELRSKTLGKPLAEANPVGEEREELFKNMREVFTTFDVFYSKNGGGEFIMGDTPGFADFMIGGVIQGLKVWGEESEEWKDFGTWDEGRWIQLLKRLEKYEGTLG